MLWLHVSEALAQVAAGILLLLLSASPHQIYNLFPTCSSVHTKQILLLSTQMHPISFVQGCDHRQKSLAGTLSLVVFSLVSSFFLHFSFSFSWNIDRIVKTFLHPRNLFVVGISYRNLEHKLCKSSLLLHFTADIWQGLLCLHSSEFRCWQATSGKKNCLICTVFLD